MTSISGFAQAQKFKAGRASLVSQGTSSQEKVAKALAFFRLGALQDRAVAERVLTKVLVIKQEIGQLEEQVAKIQRYNPAVLESRGPFLEEEGSQLTKDKAQIEQLRRSILEKRTDLNAAVDLFDDFLPGEKELLVQMNVVAEKISKKQMSVDRLNRELIGTEEVIHGEKLYLREIDPEISGEENEELDQQLRVSLVQAKFELQALQDQFSEIEDHLKDYQEIRQILKRDCARDDLLGEMSQNGSSSVEEKSSLTKASSSSSSERSFSDGEIPLTMRRFTE